MAEAVLFNLATDILESLGSFASQKIRLLNGAEDELQSLEGTVQTIRAVLLDAEKQQWHNEQVKRWLQRLKDVLYDVQDLLGDVATEALRRKVTPGNEVSKAVRIFFSKSNQLAHRLEVANKIQELRKKLDRIANDRKFHLEEHPREEEMAVGRGKKTETFSPDRAIIGREEDKKKIKQLLFDSSSSQCVSFVAIIGKGGLGKTALARLVYNDGQVKERFGLKMWVCVSDVFDANSIIKDILKSAKDNCQGHDDDEMKKLLEDFENKPSDKLQSLLLKALSSKKYLLVLDDLWNENRNKWLTLGDWLDGGERGSKILVTTRSHKVAKITDEKSVIHDLCGLSEDKSWNLFRRMAFGDGEVSLDSEQEKIGRDFLKKCAGVPLAIRTIGGFFYSKMKDEWLHYKGHELLEIPEIDEKDDGIIKVLQFSYDGLRSCLKHCFAYCSLFSKDFVYEKDMIINLWVAQGFIEPHRSQDILEEVADIYLTELQRGSFLDVESKSHDGRVMTFKMHDLMHVLAQKVAGDECKIINFEGGDYNGGIRHASFFSRILSEEKIMSLLKTSKLRTFLYSESADLRYPSSVSEPSELDYHKVFSELRYCRVFLCNQDIPLPLSSFEKLKHLRFLNISGNKSIWSLPDSITDLVNLQILILFDCANLETFSRDLRKLIKLRYLLIEECGLLGHLPPLRTLILVKLDALEFVQKTSDVGQSKTARPFFPSLERLELDFCEELKGWWGPRQVMGVYKKHHRSDNSQSFFPKLRHVQITGCTQLKFVPPFPQVEHLSICDAKMLEIMPDPNCPSRAAVGSTFSELKYLHFGGDGEDEDVESPTHKTLLQSANNLELMSLGFCNIRSFFRGMCHLSSLQELHVNYCKGLDLSCEEEDQHGTPWRFLTALRVLKILHFEDLVTLPKGFQHVKTLQYLEIYSCSQLKSLPKWIENFSLLEKLVLSKCKSFKRLPIEMCNLACLKELRILKCPVLKKKDCAHIPVIVWEDELDGSED